MAFCTECGTSVPDGIRFCIECGKPMGDTGAQPVPAMAAAPAHAAPVMSAPPIAPYAQPVYPPQQQVQQQFAPAPAYSPPPAQAQPKQAPPAQAQAAYRDDAPPKDSPYAVLSTGAYFVTCLLYSLPLVGWLICIIMAFASKNLNRRNLSKAMLIFMAIGLVVSIILYFVSQWVFSVIMESISGAAGGAVSSSMGLGDLFGILGNN